VTEYSWVVIGKGNTLDEAVINLGFEYVIKALRFMTKQILMQDTFVFSGADINSDQRAGHNHPAKEDASTLT
jgi:predicted  nucleic acid-binding Zn ribbon protein